MARRADPTTAASPSPALVSFSHWSRRLRCYGVTKSWVDASETRMTSMALGIRAIWASSVKEPYRYYTFLIVAWIGAWLLYERAGIEEWSPWQTSVYWTTSKAVVWMAPIVLIVRIAWRRPTLDYLGLVRGGRGVRVGLVIGAIFVTLSACIDAFTRSYGWPTMGPGLANALIIAPLFEEVMFRGFVLRVLEERGYRFWTANGVAALMFLGLHLPGWWFMGVMAPPQIIAGVSVILIGLVAGYAARRAQSTWAAVAVHFVNNLYAAFLR